jgi:hypothetical protein
MKDLRIVNDKNVQLLWKFEMMFLMRYKNWGKILEASVFEEKNLSRIEVKGV